MSLEVVNRPHLASQLVQLELHIRDAQVGDADQVVACALPLGLGHRRAASDRVPRGVQEG